MQLSIQIDVEYFFQQFKVKPLLKIFFIMILQGFQFFGFEFAEWFLIQIQKKITSKLLLQKIEILMCHKILGSTLNF